VLLGVIADDFTGASDIANTLAKGANDKGGLRTVQFLGLQQGHAPATCEAGVVSLKSRSIPAQDAVHQSLNALEWLLEQGCSQIVFKYCSTFDSTPLGNIGPVGEALAHRLGVKGVISCPAFPGAGRTVYRGHLFVHDQLLSESGLEHHPLNPMTDSNLVRWLGHQAKDPVGLVTWPTVARGAEAVRQAMSEASARGETLMIADALSNEDLLTLGEAAYDAPLLTGGSGIALGLPQNFIKQGLAQGGRHTQQSVDGPEAILAGSCSRATLGQIAWHQADGHPCWNLSVEGVLSGKIGAIDVVRYCEERRGAAPLVYTSSTPEMVHALQARHGRDRIAKRLDELFGEAARQLVENGTRRLVVAGGETSGAVVSALGLDALGIGVEIDPGVPVLTTTDGNLALVLKSGNFGSEDFFNKALGCMKRAAA
jgi:3-dehydrotetronate 4-kinase